MRRGSASRRERNIDALKLLLQYSDENVKESVAEEAARSESKVLRLFELFLITYTYGWPIDIETTEEKLDSINSQVPKVGIFITY